MELLIFHGLIPLNRFADAIFLLQNNKKLTYSTRAYFLHQCGKLRDIQFQTKFIFQNCDIKDNCSNNSKIPVKSIDNQMEANIGNSIITNVSVSDGNSVVSSPDSISKLSTRDVVTSAAEHTNQFSLNAQGSAVNGIVGSNSFASKGQATYIQILASHIQRAKQTMIRIFIHACLYKNHAMALVALVALYYLSTGVLLSTLKCIPGLEMMVDEFRKFLQMSITMGFGSS
jgi:hypothetical protein